MRLQEDFGRVKNMADGGMFHAAETPRNHMYHIVITAKGLPFTAFHNILGFFQSSKTKRSMKKIAL